MKLLHTLILVLLVVVGTGCATSPKMNGLSIGMTKPEVISVMGSPSSTAAPGNGMELLRYRLSPTDDHAFRGITEEYFVKLVNGKVDSYGKMGDFNSARDPTLNLKIQNK